MLDFHNHLIPGVDDGCRSLLESRAALHAMAEQGFTAIIATPHFAGSLINRPEGGDALARIETAWIDLRMLGEKEFASVRLERGLEILIDAPRLDFSDPRLRLAGTGFVLVEFPWSGNPVYSGDALFDMSTQGFTPIVGHPERYAYMDREGDLAREWSDRGALLQVNAGSLVGRYGRRAHDIGWSLLEQGLASYICSDYHGRGQCPSASALAKLRDYPNGETVGGLLMSTNPMRILEKSQPAPVPRLGTRKRFWRRIADKFST